MAIISQDEYLVSKSFQNFCKNFHTAELLKRSNVRKERGIPANTIFVALLTLAFGQRSLSRSIKDGHLPFKKDTVYRFINSVYTNWQRFLLLLSSAVIETIVPLTSPNRINTLILDDSLYKRNSSNKVELLTRVRDHSNGRCYRGFRCLTLAWSDGNTLLPVNFNLLSSVKAKTRINDADPKIDKRTTGYKRRENAQQGSYEAAFALLQQAVKQRLPASHVLFDSWFSAPTMFLTLRGMGLHGLGMLRSMNRPYYHYKGRFCKLETLYAKVAFRLKCDQDMASLTVTLNDANATPMKIVFVRHEHKSRDWFAIGTTDLALTEEEIVCLYGRRWGIEVCFKQVKQLLRFAQEFQSRSYDALHAEIAVVFTRYMMLALMARQNNDGRGFGELFYELYDEMQDMSLVEALKCIITLLRRALNETLGKTLADIMEIYFFALLPTFIRDLLPKLNCET